MRRWLVVLLYSIGAIAGAHGLVYLLVGALPSAATTALGLFSANEKVLSAFAQSFPSRSYLATLGGIFVGDFGRTLDGQGVASEVARALAESGPRLAVALLLLAGSCYITAMRVKDRPSLFQSIEDFIAFLPPYVMPFLGLTTILGVQFSTNLTVSKLAIEICAVFSLSAGGSALLAAQTARIMQRNLRSDFGRSLRAAGARNQQLRHRLLHNLVVEIGPTFEKMLVGLVAALFFTEPILGLSGFGTLATRAVRRSDIDLLLGVTLIVASMVAFSRLLFRIIRTSYGVEE